MLVRMASLLLAGLTILGTTHGMARRTIMLRPAIRRAIAASLCRPAGTALFLKAKRTTSQSTAGISTNNLCHECFPGRCLNECEDHIETRMSCLFKNPDNLAKFAKSGDKNKRMGKWGYTLLHWAIHFGHTDPAVYKTLLNYGVDPLLRNKAGLTASQMFSEQHNADYQALQKRDCLLNQERIEHFETVANNLTQAEKRITLSKTI